jgi:5-methylcytosine-specific restriction endonuclease McrA
MSAGKRRGRSHRVSNVAERSHTEEKYLLYSIQHGKCWYCANHVLKCDATVDHVIPKSKGGTDDFSNKVMACYSCNQDKADKVPEVVCGKLQLS